jgi:hypothetical protein
MLDFLATLHMLGGVLYGWSLSLITIMAGICGDIYNAPPFYA